jgi:hypothetical protein
MSEDVSSQFHSQKNKRAILGSLHTNDQCVLSANGQLGFVKRAPASNDGTLTGNVSASPAGLQTIGTELSKNLPKIKGMLPHEGRIPFIS